MNRFSGGGDYALQISDDFVVGPKYEHELGNADFVNHSCEPNSGFKGQIFLIAMRDIQPDEEITFDYAMCLNPVDGRTYEFDCACGSPLCRGKISFGDWQIPALQARYDGWFQWYLQEKINSLKFKSAGEPAHSKWVTPL